MTITEEKFLNHPKIIAKGSLGYVFSSLVDLKQEIFEDDNDDHLTFKTLLKMATDEDSSITMDMLNDVYDNNDWECLSPKQLNLLNVSFTVRNILVWY